MLKTIHRDIRWIIIVFLRIQQSIRLSRFVESILVVASRRFLELADERLMSEVKKEKKKRKKKNNNIESKIYIARARAS